MTDEPLVPGPLYGLRTWSVVGEAGSERLAAPHHGVTWPADGEQLEAACPAGHTPPAPDCDCGVHAWHPRARWARRVMAARRQVPGVVEASGAIELYEDGFRAQRGRPHALVLAVDRNPRLVHRLATAYGVAVVEARRPEDLVEWCRARGLGLDESVVAGMLGAAALEQRRRAGRNRAWVAALRTIAALALVALLLALGLVATDSPGDRTLFGRTGEIHRQR